MKRILNAAAAVMILSTAASLTGCGEKYEFTYNDNYKGVNTEILFSMDWDSMSLCADVDEKMENELPDKNVTVSGTKLKGLFDKNIEFSDTEDEDEYYFGYDNFEDDYEVGEYIKKFGDKYTFDNGTVYVAPIDVECEFTDKELYVEVVVCPESMLDDADDMDDLYMAAFGFDMK